MTSLFMKSRDRRVFVMFCVKCGSKVTEGSRFCNVCGTQLQNNAVNQQIQTNPAPYAQPNTMPYPQYYPTSGSNNKIPMKVIIVVVSLIVVVIITVVLLLSSINKGVSSSVDGPRKVWCTHCGGDGIVECGGCKGSGRLNGTVCIACNGKGYSTCYYCHGVGWRGEYD